MKANKYAKVGFLYIIVGVDPGTTVGLSFIDLKGNMILAKSIRNASRKDIVREIEKIGTPVIVACDKKTVPELVLKVAASFNTRFYSPGKDLSLSEKSRLTKDYAITDDHQRDALASALKAYHYYENKFRQIDALPYSDKEKEKIKYFMLSGTKMSDAILFLHLRTNVSNGKVSKKPSQRRKDARTMDRTMDKCICRIRELARENVELRKALARERARMKLITERIERIKRVGMEKIMRDREIRKLRARLLRLENKIARLNGEIRRLRTMKTRRTVKHDSSGYKDDAFKCRMDEKTGQKEEKMREERKKMDDEKEGMDLKNLLEDIINEYRQKRQGRNNEQKDEKEG